MMAKFTVTYTAPEGDSDVVETLGYKFFNGVAATLDDAEDAFALGILSDNRWFQVEAYKAPVGKPPASAPKPAIPAALDELPPH
jgi:hypothetical protein